MSPEQLTQAAAKHCADLANAVREERAFPHIWGVEHFAEKSSSETVAFRREVEAKDAMIREVLALLDEVIGDTPRGRNLLMLAKNKLRDNLLPDPKPTLLEEFVSDHEGLVGTGKFIEGVTAALEWVASRGEAGS